MSQQKMVRVGIFHDAETARRAINAARAEGFKDIHLVSEDRAVQAELSHEIERDKHLLARSPAIIAPGFGIVGAGIGLFFGFAATWSLGSWMGTSGIADFVLLSAGTIFGGFLGAMASRGFTSEAQDFYDQDLGPSDILVVIEANTPARLTLAELILRTQGAAPLALSEG